MSLTLTVGGKKGEEEEDEEEDDWEVVEAKILPTTAEKQTDEDVVDDWDAGEAADSWEALA